ncbi:ATP-binding cassette sub-family C member 8-like isoform X2 [Eriocheir sinensis]|uniref:ATP-binding cassette sub-family C member 8-like isoform X2 n=1 Tax=Eriocheir sinensis TaxID=95602 RepID=UPI0021CA923C|nr:ATP-binding cassette sub-family C member 8-like isoform X2 [Eriocheir sinensis]
MGDPLRPGEGGPVSEATAPALEWTPASTERALRAFLNSVLQDLSRPPPSKSEQVNFTAIAEEFLATSSTTAKVHTLPAFFTRPEAPDILAVAVEGSWAVVAIAALLIGRCSTTAPRGATSAPTLLYAHGVRTLTLLLLTLVQMGACGEAGFRYYHSQAPHILLLPAHALALATTLLLWALYHHLEAWHCEGGVGVGVGVWACGACVGGVRTWQAVGVGGVPPLLVYPTLSLACGLLQLLLCCLDAAALLHWRNTQVLEITPGTGERGAAAAGGPEGGGGLAYRHSHVGLPSRATFTWYLHLLRLGWQRPLGYPDLGKLPRNEEANNQHERLIAHYHREQERVGAGRSPSLWRVFALTYWREMTLGGLFKLLGDAVNVVGPLAISLIVTYVTQVQEGKWVNEGVVVDKIYYVGWAEAARNGWVVAGVALVAALAQSTFSQTSTHLVAMEGIHAKAALQVMIYNKTLRLPSTFTPTTAPDGGADAAGGRNGTVGGKGSENGRVTVSEGGKVAGGGGGATEGRRGASEAGDGGQDAGSIINLTSEDADNILTFFLHCHYTWAIPMKVSVIMALLWVQLGTSAVVAALAAILLLTPLQFLLCRRIADTNKTFLTVSDERLRRTCEVLAAARVVKVHGWEEEFLSKITSVRKKELALLHRDSLLRAFMTFLTQAAGVLVSLVTFGLYTLVEGRPLEAGRVFSGMALFNQLTVPLFILPIILSHTIRAKNSVRRLEAFFRTPDVEGPRTPLTPITLRVPRGEGSGVHVEKEGGGGGKGGKATSGGGRGGGGGGSNGQEMKTSRLSRVNEESRPTSACSLLSSSTSKVEEEDDDDDDDDDEEINGGTGNKSQAFTLPVQSNGEAEKRRGDAQTAAGERRQVAVSVQCGTFAWPTLGRCPALEDITTQVPTGGLTVVLGAVGSGKTSFLLALLGELCTVRGQLRWFGEMSVAYVPQQPWLQNASLRDNILFGRRYLARRYQRVLAACALQPDVDILPHGDLTEIGERGISLSGGQRQRVALARALYSDARTVILDSPFSALDSGVGGSVWEAGVLGLLLGRRRTVILATHLMHFSRRANKIIYLEGGRISVQGSPQEVARAAPMLWRAWGGGGEGQGTQGAAEGAAGEGRTARERWALVRLVSRLALRNSTTRGSRRDNGDEHGAEDHEDYLGGGHSRAARQYSMNREVPHSALLPGDEYVYLPPALTPLLPPHPLLNPSSSTISSSYKLQLFRIKSSAPAFGRKASQLEPVRQVPRHALSLPPQPRPAPPRTRTAAQPLLSRLLSSASFRSVRRAGNNQSERWNIRSLFSPSTALEEDLELEEEVPIEEDVEEDGKLEEEEQEERGRSSSSTWNYLVYLRACGVSMGLAYLLCAVAGQGVTVGLDFWLGRWTGQASHWNETKPGDKKSEEAMQAFVEETMSSYYQVYAMLSAVSVVLSLSTNLLGQLAAGRGRRNLHHGMLRALVKAAPRFLDDTPAGRLLNRVTNDTAMIDKELARSVTHLLFFVLLVTSAVLVNAAVTPAFLAAAVPICLVYYAVQKFFRCSSRELKRLESLSRSPLLSHLGETVGGACVVRAYGQERRFQQVFLHRLDTHLAAFILLHAGNRWLGICLDYIGGIIVFCATAASLLGSTTGLGPRLTPDMVGLAINYTLLVPVYLNWVVRFLADTEMGLCSVERVHRYASLPAEEEDDHHDEDEEEEEDDDNKKHKRSPAFSDDIEANQRYRRRHSQVSFKCRRMSSGLPPGWPLEGKVEFRSVTLRHHQSRPIILSDLNFVIKPGEKVGVCGRTGSGKSTLALALLRVVRATKGSILIDGTDLRHVPLHILRASTSLIPQDSHLFCGTVRFNCDPLGKATEQEVWRALEAVQLKDLVTDLPRRLESEVLEGGANFSGGQRQLFCVARALLRRSSLLILDEATSALDPPTEKALHHALTHAAAHATVITIAHGRRSLMTLPRVLVLENGRLAEDGDPKVLARKPDGAFARLLSSTNDPATFTTARDEPPIENGARRPLYRV